MLLEKIKIFFLNLKLKNQIEKEFNAIFIPIDKLTEGTACTVLYARKYINNDEPLLIANSRFYR